MSIMLLSEIFPPKHGGSGRWFFELYRRLAPGTVAVVTQKTDGHACEAVDKDFPQPVHRIEMTSSSWGLLNARGLFFYLRTLFRVLKCRPAGLTQIHCGRTIPEGFVGLMLSSILRKPLLCYVHGEDIEVARTSRELTWIVRRVLRGASQLICNSNNTRSLLIEHWQVAPEKLVVIHPGVDTDRFKPAPVDQRLRQNLGWSDRFVCLTVGRLQRRKGHDKMIEAIPLLVRHIPNILYVIVGQGDYYRRLVDLTAELGVVDHVQFMSEIDDVELIQCYQQCDLFILPNRSDGSDIEGFGMVLVEAQAAGKPVVAGDSGGTAETLKPGETGLIADCTDTSRITEAVVIIKEAAANGRFRSDVCRRHVMQNLTWEIHSERAMQEFGRWSVAE